MQNPKHKILTLATHDDDITGTVPTIPGAELYTGAGDWIIVYGPAVKRVHPAIAMCQLVTGTTYLAIAEQTKITEMDKSNKGKTVEEYGLDWKQWRYNGTEPDPTDDAKPGDKINVSGGLIKFAGATTDMSGASALSPVTVGDKQVKKAWPSLESTIAGHDLLTVVEPPGSRSVVEIG